MSAGCFSGEKGLWSVAEEAFLPLRILVLLLRAASAFNSEWLRTRIADRCAPLADVATKQWQTYLRYLEELDERERNTIARRIKDARMPRMKTLEEFDFSKAPQVAATRIHELAQGGCIERAEPIVL